MTPQTDLFHQPVFSDADFMVIADYTGDVSPFPQYRVYELRTCQVIGYTNACNFMGTCRMIINDYLKRQQNEN